MNFIDLFKYFRRWDNENSDVSFGYTRDLDGAENIILGSIVGFILVARKMK